MPMKALRILCELLLIIFIIGCKAGLKIKNKDDNNNSKNNINNISLFIEVFENKTQEQMLERILYNQLLEEFPQGQRNLPSDLGYVLGGRILAFERIPLLFSKNSTVETYILKIQLVIFVVDKQKKENIYEKKYIISQQCEYEKEEIVKNSILKQLAKVIILDIWSMFMRQR